MRLSSGHNKIGEIVRLPHEIVAAVFFASCRYGKILKCVKLHLDTWTKKVYNIMCMIKG